MDSYRSRSLLALLAVSLLGLAFAEDGFAQQSASYRLEEHAFNAGGHPENGVTPASAGFRLSLDAIGDGVVPGALSSVSYRLDGGFVSAYPPPGEVTGLFLSDSQTLIWAPEVSAGRYNIYRDSLSALSGLGYGQCRQPEIVTPTTTDPDLPSTPGDGFFFLVTAENRLGEEGAKGWDSGGTKRPNPEPCP